ncbi:MAG: hypothetical protein P8Y05_05905 [Deinococcales bacterium]
MRTRLPLIVLALGMALLVAGCGQQPAPATITTLSPSAATLPASGGSDTLSWSATGATDYALAVSPGTGVKVNGAAYAGAVDLNTSTSATVTLPGNTSSTGVTYTFTLTASGARGSTPTTKTVKVTVGAAAPSIANLTASPASLTAAAGPLSLAWTGSAVVNYSLTVNPSAGVKVNGTAYAGVVDLGTSTSASVTLPGNAGSSSVTYTFTLTASGGAGTTPATKTTTVSVPAQIPEEGLWVADPSAPVRTRPGLRSTPTATYGCRARVATRSPSTLQGR